METEILQVLNRNLQSIWDVDVATYTKTCAPDVSFFEWYITTQRIDGIDFHLHEILVHVQALGGGEGARTEHEVLQPRDTDLRRHCDCHLHLVSASGEGRRGHADTAERDARVSSLRRRLEAGALS